MEAVEAAAAGVAVEEEVPAGSASVAETPVAVPAPSLASVTAKPIWPPAATSALSALFVILRSGVPAGP